MLRGATSSPAVVTHTVPLTPPASSSTTFEFAFDDDPQGWEVGYADLPVDYDQSIYELKHGHRTLPDGLEGSGIYIQGHNRSDDLFMFLTRQVNGLTPDATYEVSASIDLATNVPVGSVGISGSPGSSVYVKAGASTNKPEAMVDQNQYFRMNIDKGNQSRGGTDMTVLGNVENPNVDGERIPDQDARNHGPAPDRASGRSRQRMADSRNRLRFRGTERFLLRPNRLRP